MTIPCPVCHDTRSIRLPHHYPPSAFFAHDSSLLREFGICDDTYPCPACTGGLKEERVAFIQTVDEIRAWRGIETAEMDQIRRIAADTIVHALLKRGLIRVELRSDPSDSTRLEVQAELAVLSDSSVASMKERIAERQDEVAAEVVQEAMRRITEWDKDYDHLHDGTIPKDVAKSAAYAALMKVLKDRGGPMTNYPRPDRRAGRSHAGVRR